MSGILKYKDFYGSIELSYEDKILHGKIECINDLVTYEAETINDLEAAFREAVDDYLDTCKSLGKKPEKPMSGTFNIRIGSELHQKAYLAATENGMKLNEFIKQAVSEKLSAKKKFIIILNRLRQYREVDLLLHIENSQILYGPHKTKGEYNIDHKENILRWIRCNFITIC